LTYTTQAIILLTILNRRFSGLLDIGSTAPRAFLAALVTGSVTLMIMNSHLLPTLPITLIALVIGGLIAIPFIWPEIKLLLKL